MKSENGNVKADESLHGVGEELTTPGRSHLSSTLPPSASRCQTDTGTMSAPSWVNTSSALGRLTFPFFGSDTSLIQALCDPQSRVRLPLPRLKRGLPQSRLPCLTF